MPDARQPVLYIPHGGGPCFFMEWSPPGTWDKMAAWLRGLPLGLDVRPKAVLVISGHWEEDPVAVTAQVAPALLYDYYGFPEHTYQLTYPAPGAPVLADRVAELLGGSVRKEMNRGFDHGVFIPLKVIFPEANVPIVQLSLKKGLNPADHVAMGHKLAPLRDEGVLIVGSGMSFHNLRAFGPEAGPLSDEFDAWLTKAVCAADHNEALTGWAKAPGARFAHPREEHLIPLMVAGGAADQQVGVKLFQDRVMGATVSAFGFGV